MKFEEFKKLSPEMQVVVRILDRIEAKVDMLLLQNDEIVAHQRRLTDGVEDLDRTLDEEIRHEHERTGRKLEEDDRGAGFASAGSNDRAGDMREWPVGVGAGGPDGQAGARGSAAVDGVGGDGNDPSVREPVGEANSAA